MKILVTGREGQLARALAEKAAGRRSMDLAAVGRPEADLAVAGSLARVIRSTRPDIVVNAAAYTAVDQAEDEPDLAFRINAEAAGEAAEASREIGARIIQISTDYIFDGRGPGPYGEEAIPNPLSAYGRSKLAGEEAVRTAQPDHLIVRTSWLYSPYGRNFVRTMIDAARTRDRMRVVDDQRGNPSSALDVADGLLRVIDRWRGGDRAGLGEIFHLAGTGATSWFGFARFIMDELDARGAPSADVEPIGASEWPARAQRPRNSALDCTKFANIFAFTMPEWQSSVRDTVALIIGD